MGGIVSKQAIDSIRQAIDAAWLRSDAEGITRHLAEDAVLMPPHADKQVGRQQITSWLTGLFEHFTMTELAMPERELTISGDLAVERSLYQWTLTPRDGSEPIRDQANWIGIWRQTRDGWSEVCGIWNSTLPAPTAAPQPVEQG
jgi:uncharacterized protein (TIGR02246 family)